MPPARRSLAVGTLALASFRKRGSLARKAESFLCRLEALRRRPAPSAEPSDVTRLFKLHPEGRETLLEPPPSRQGGRSAEGLRPRDLHQVLGDTPANVNSEGDQLVHNEVFAASSLDREVVDVQLGLCSGSYAKRLVDDVNQH